MVVRTDHAALTHLLRTKEPIGQQGRWLDLLGLGEFQLTIQHRPGRVHSNSDALSRRPCLQDDEVECKQCSWAIDRQRQLQLAFTIHLWKDLSPAIRQRTHLAMEQRDWWNSSLQTRLQPRLW